MWENDQTRAQPLTGFDRARRVASALSELPILKDIPIPHGNRKIEIQVIRTNPKLLPATLEKIYSDAPGKEIKKEPRKALMFSCPPPNTTDKVFENKNGRTIIRAIMTQANTLKIRSISIQSFAAS